MPSGRYQKCHSNTSRGFSEAAQGTSGIAQEVLSAGSTRQAADKENHGPLPRPNRSPTYRGSRPPNASWQGTFAERPQCLRSNAELGQEVPDSESSGDSSSLLSSWGSSGEYSGTSPLPWGGGLGGLGGASPLRQGGPPGSPAPSSFLTPRGCLRRVRTITDCATFL